MTVDYKKYSLEQLDNWIHDVMNVDDLTPKEIYDTIVSCVQDNVDYHKKHLEKGAKLLSLMKGQHHDDLYKEIIRAASDKDWDDFWNFPDESKFLSENMEEQD